MKIRFLFSDYKPAFKCGATAAAAGALGGLNFMSSIYQAEMASENVDKQLGAQRSENQKNRDWQTEQAEIARNWEAGQVQQQNQFVAQQAAQQQQYNLNAMKQQAMYNSPVYQRQMLEAAGINPQVYFGTKGSFQGSSAIAGGAPSVPSPGSSPGVGSVQGLNPVGYQPPDLKIPAFISSLGSMMSGLANAKKSGVETSFLEQSLEARIKEAVAKGDMAETAAALQQLDLAFQKANFDTRLQHAYVQYKETLTNINLLSEQALTEKEEQSLKRATAAMNKAIQELNEEEKNKLGIVVQFLPRMLESEILSNRGSAAAGFAKAEESHASAEQIGLFNKIYSDRRYQHSIISQAVTAGQQAIDANKMTKKQVEQLNYMIEQAAYANDMKEFTYWSNQINGFVGTIGQAASQFYGAGALRELIKLRQAGKSSPLESGKGYYMDNDGLLFKRP